METEEDTKTLTDYLHMFKRHEYIITIPILFLFGISIIVALVLPPVYRSEATILIEQQRIPLDLVKSTVASFADERIRQIEQKLMTVSNLSKIINKYNLYESERKGMTVSELADRFRENTKLEMIDTNVIMQGRAQKATLAFRLSFDDRNPVMAQKVANEIVSLFLDENIKNRTQSAADTSNFLAEEAKRFKLEIQNTERKLAEYKEQYNNSLPEVLSVNFAAVNRIESELLQLELQEKMLTERGLSLRSQLLVTDPVMPTGNNKIMPDSLPVLEEQYEQLLAKYSKNHPDVKALKRKIDSFKEKEGEKKSHSNANNPVYVQLQSDIKLTEIELDNLNRHRDELRKKLKQIEMNIAQTPQIERGYNNLIRDLDNYKAKYNELNAKALEASLSLTLEEEQKAEKFSLLEPPLVPTKAEKPDRLKIFFLGIVVSIGSGFGLGFVAEMMDDSIRGHKKLAIITGAEPLIVIPYINNQDDLDNSRKSIMNFAIIGFLLLVVSIVVVHFLYMHLDVIWNKIWYRLATL